MFQRDRHIDEIKKHLQSLKAKNLFFYTLCNYLSNSIKSTTFKQNKNFKKTYKKIFSYSDVVKVMGQMIISIINILWSEICRRHIKVLDKSETKDGIVSIEPKDIKNSQAILLH